MAIITIDTVDFTVTYEESEAVRVKVFDAVIAWFAHHEAFDRESIMQMDEPIIDAPRFLGELSENVIEFSVEWK